MRIFLVLFSCILFLGCTASSTVTLTEPQIYHAPSISGQLVSLPSLTPIKAEVSHGNFLNVSSNSDDMGRFQLPAAQAEEVKLLLPAAGQKFQPLLIDAEGYSSTVVWLPVFLSQRTHFQAQSLYRGNVEQAGYILLDSEPEVIVESLSDFALPYAAIQRPIVACDDTAWQQALLLTNSARKLAAHIDELMTVGQIMSGRQQLMLMDSYQQVETAWQVVWFSCRFDETSEREQAEKLFQRLAREALSMREALYLVDVNSPI